ncbi:sensor histidine kinase [Plantactinospora sp. S1510]|uniref:histidine kinase n=1 Tax=Plantactinospora alkalitolerans TaxID=2789879 RepID=A0ABS0H6Q2_9ACTN|nr:ATP-binding protein [Plantactinospora alkalitolerans]MBF9134145.1 sensor histidine kinase [Plantactinospora alkalitolerans]
MWSATFTITALAAVAAVAGAVISGSLRGVAVGVLAAAVAVLLLTLLRRLRRRQRATWAAFEQHEREVERRILGYQHQLAEREAEWADRAEARSAAVNGALEHLLRVRLSAAMAGSPVPPAYGDSELDEVAASLVDGVLAEATSALKRADEREESLRLAVVALSRRVQTAAHSIQEHVSLMADRHQHDPDVVESSMRVDHAAAQQARHAQSLAVLCGEWPGQQWQEPLAMVDVVRAASARILAYQRVEVSGDQDVAVAAEVVEPVIHLVAELLANATQSSPPATSVPVTVRRVQRGAVIEIDDGGVGMDEHRLEQAREIVSGRRRAGLGDLGEIPQTGLAVVGHYVRRHGFRADLSESPYGGLRAVVLIPSKVVETVEPPEAIAARPAARQATPVVEAGPRTSVDTASADSPPAGATLPQRRSRRGQAAAAVPEESAPASSSPTPEQAGSWMGAFIEGGRTGGEPDPAGTS